MKSSAPGWVFGLGAVGALAPMGCSLGSSSDLANGGSGTAAGTGATGSVEVALSTPAGVTIDQVQYQVTGPTTLSGSVDVSQAQGSIEFVVGPLSAGPGYTIALNAIDTADDSCTSVATPFAIMTGATSQLAVGLVCTVGDGAVTFADAGTGSLEVEASVTVVDDPSTVCPVIGGIGISPAAEEVGATSAISAVTAPEGAAVQYTVTPAVDGGAGGGTVSTTSAGTVFTCTSPGQVLLTASTTAPLANDAGNCPWQSMSAVITCEAAPADGASTDGTIELLDAPVDAPVAVEPLDAQVDAPTEASSAPPTFDGGAGWQSVTDAGVAVTTLTDGGFPSVQCIALATSDVVFDPTRFLLYASVMSTVPVFGNSVVRIDPAAGAITGTVFVGSNPDALAISDDATSLYVGLDGSASVVAVDPATGYLGTPVYLGVSQFEGPRTAGEIRAVPGSSTQYVVSRRVTGFDPSFTGLALYDGATLLGEWDGFVGGESIAFVSPSVLFGFNNEDTGFDLFEFAVGPTGITAVADTMGVVTGFDTTITAQGGWVFATDGVAVNASNMQPVGQYAAFGPVWPATDEANVWFLTSGPTLVDFDRTTFLQSRSISLPADAGGGSPESLIGLSASSFVFNTSSNVCIASISP